jgi:hypothetical protein
MDKNLEEILHPKKKSFKYFLKKKLLKLLLYMSLFYWIIPPYIFPVNGSVSSRYFLRMKPEYRVITSMEPAVP